VVSCVRYTLDSTGAILSTGDGWDEFAIAGSAPSLAGAGARQLNLFEIVRGRRVHDFYRSLFRSILDGTLPSFEMPVRWDAPEVRRFGRFQVQRLGGRDDVLACLAVTDREEPRAPVLLLQAPPAIAAGPPLPVVPLCSFCKDVKLPVFGQVWAPTEQYLAAGFPTEVRVSHGTCPGCLEQLAGWLDSLGA